MLGCVNSPQKNDAKMHVSHRPLFAAVISGVQPTELGLKNLLSLPWPIALGLVMSIESTHLLAISVCPSRMRMDRRQSPTLSLAEGLAPWARSTSNAARLSSCEAWKRRLHSPCFLVEKKLRNFLSLYLH